MLQLYWIFWGPSMQFYVLYQRKTALECLRLGCVALTLLFLLVVHTGELSAQEFTFQSIDVNGNQRIDSSTIEAYAEIRLNETVSSEDINNAYQRILASGLFERIELIPRNATLVISVVEFPTINRVTFEGNRRIEDEDLATFIESAPRKVLNPSVAERDANIIAEAYSQQGRISATVKPRIIRRSDNRVDLIFEIGEAGPIEIERVSFVGNRIFSDRRLRRVMQTKQANLLRSFLRSDTLVEDRIEFDKQVLTDFYQARGYVDFRINSVNVELTEERDGFFLVMNVQEGRQFRFGQIATISEYSRADPESYQDALQITEGDVYSPNLIEESLARMERMALIEGTDFLRVEPRVTRNDRTLTLDVAFVISRGELVFVERIDIEGNTTTLDRVIRQQFLIAEGDPFNPRAIRASAERIRALGFFSDTQVESREGSSPDRVVIDVDVEEQPTGSLSLGGSYSRNSGFGVAIGLKENNFLGRGQELSFDWSTASDSEIYSFGFVEPYLYGRDLALNLSLGYTEEDSSFSSFDNERVFFRSGLTFPANERGKLNVRLFYEQAEMLSRAADSSGVVIQKEINLGEQVASGIGYRYSFDSRRAGLDPNAGVLTEIGQDIAGLGGDSEYVSTYARLVARTLVLNEEVTLRASTEVGVLSWLGESVSRRPDRFVFFPSVFRGFEPAGVGPRDQANDADDALGGNYLAVARFEAEFPLGLPAEVGIRGGVFYDIGNIWNLKDVDTKGGSIVGADGSIRHVIGASLLWDTPIGPLRFNFSDALRKESYDKEQSFDFTLQTSF